MRQRRNVVHEGSVLDYRVLAMHQPMLFLTSRQAVEAPLVGAHGGFRLPEQIPSE
ncbi:hypothetical protein BH09ACT12_BH09ACT12_30610 [soil metagenome]